MNLKIYGLLGDGGYAFSPAFNTYLEKLGTLFGCERMTLPDSGRDTNTVCLDILAQPPARKIVILGYSLGANGCAWVQQALRAVCRAQQVPVRPIDLIVGFDPTKNGPDLKNWPIEAHVKRCLLFQQMDWWWPTSLWFGRGKYTAAPGGPAIETTQVHMDHLLVQGSKKLQDICTQAIGDTMRSGEPRYYRSENET